MWALCTRVAFEQVVTIPRLPGVVSVAETWDGPGVTALAGDGVLRDQVTETVDGALIQFLNAWLEANPKGAH